MFIRSFEYLSPRSIEEACSFLSEHHEQARVLAGGQSLIPLMKLNLVDVKYVVDLKRIPGLAGVTKSDGLVKVGVLTTHSQVAESEIIRSTLPLLSDTASKIGHPQVRNRGTIGGSLSHADPAADYIPTLLVLEGWLDTVSPGGTRRRTPAGEFFKGAFSTALGRGEILEEIEVPIPPQGVSHTFLKLTLGHGDFPLLVVSALGSMKNGSFEEVRIGLGGASEVAFRSREAEEYLKGKAATQENIREASRLAAQRAKPEGDLGVSKEYKARMLDVYLRRALEAISRSGE